MNAEYHAAGHSMGYRRRPLPIAISSAPAFLGDQLLQLVVRHVRELVDATNICYSEQKVFSHSKHRKHLRCRRACSFFFVYLALGVDRAISRSMRSARPASSRKNVYQYHARKMSVPMSHTSPSGCIAVAGISMRAMPHVAATRRASAASVRRSGLPAGSLEMTKSSTMNSAAIAPMKISRYLIISASVSIFDLHEARSTAIQSPRPHP